MLPLQVLVGANSTTMPIVGRQRETAPVGPPRPRAEELLPLAFTFSEARKGSLKRGYLTRISYVFFEPLV